MFVQIDTDGRIMASTTEREYTDSSYMEIDLPAEFDPLKQNDYRISAGNLIYDPLPPDPTAEGSTEEILAKQRDMLTTMLVTRMASTLSDAEAESISLMFSTWTVGTSYTTGDIVRYNGGLYRALQDSVADEIFPPDTYVSGWKRIGEPDDDGYYPWSQPLGATDAYPKDTIVSHNGSLWISTVDNNVWEPGVYGWTAYDPKDPDPEPGVAEWKQPLGAHDAYKLGDRVTHNGSLWESLVDNNVWEPGVYGWNQILI